MAAKSKSRMHYAWIVFAALMALAIGRRGWAVELAGVPGEPA